MKKLVSKILPARLELKVGRVIRSCTTEDQVAVARKYAYLAAATINPDDWYEMEDKRCDFDSIILDQYRKIDEANETLLNTPTLQKSKAG